jgi:hypothetical protein
MICDQCIQQNQHQVSMVKVSGDNKQRWKLFMPPDRMIGGIQFYTCPCVRVCVCVTLDVKFFSSKISMFSCGT